MPTHAFPPHLEYIIKVTHEEMGTGLYPVEDKEMRASEREVN